LPLGLCLGGKGRSQQAGVKRFLCAARRRKRICSKAYRIAHGSEVCLRIVVPIILILRTDLGSVFHHIVIVSHAAPIALGILGASLLARPLHPRISSRTSLASGYPSCTSNKQILWQPLADLHTFSLPQGCLFPSRQNLAGSSPSENHDAVGGTLFESDPRSVLKKMHSQAARVALGLLLFGLNPAHGFIGVAPSSRLPATAGTGISQKSFISAGRMPLAKSARRMETSSRGATR